MLKKTRAWLARYSPVTLLVVPGQAWQPQGERTRVVTRALKAYAAFATSADRGGFRDL